VGDVREASAPVPGREKVTGVADAELGFVAARRASAATASSAIRHAP
jgi:hypothetical protein